MRKKPNILFLMSDQHRADVTGYAGNDVVRTPVLDELARTGMVFTNAYTPAPVCIPARQAILSGQFPKHNGCEKSSQDLDPGYLTYAQQLTDYGYTTVACGKLGHKGTDQMQGWTRRIGGDIKVDNQFLSEKAQAAVQKKPKRKAPLGTGIVRAGIGKGKCVSFDEYAMEGALRFIQSRFCNAYEDRDHSEPLLLKISLLQPHSPYLTSEPKLTYYVNRIKPYLNQQPFDHPFLSNKYIRQGEAVTERDITRATASYYGMVETVDEHFGKILDALHHAGQNLDDWIIIYTSDHGEMLGEYGVWEKGQFFEASIRVPLIIRYPKRFKAGNVITENVNLCDLFATLCELTETPIPEGLDSRSLVPLLKGNTVRWDNESISHFIGKSGVANLMIKRDHLKYQNYGAKIPEVLFDLKRDALESKNFADDPQYAEPMKQFRIRAKELGYG